MPTVKRASMREGPLAALFRKTAQDIDDRGGIQERPSAAPGAPDTAASEEPAGSPAEEPASPPAGPEVEDEPRIPLPHERLRHAFSADIPENLLERSAVPEPVAPEPVAPQPVHDVYARVTRDEPAPEPVSGGPVLRVVGVGGAGVNAINRMVEAEIEGVEFLAINTDLQSLQQSSAHETLHIGDSITHGLGSGSTPELGRAAAREEYDRIKAMLRGSDMVFIAAGAGGGTGTGAAPIIAQIARELGALTVGIVSRPFQFEGSRRRDQAERKSRPCV